MSSADLIPNSTESYDLATRAWRFLDQNDCARGIECATQAIQLNPGLATAYYARALMMHRLQQWESAILDYSHTLHLDECNARAWLLRGACRSGKASRSQQGEGYVRLWEEAADDIRRAATLAPHDEDVALSFLEYEICSGKYRDAVSTTGEWWDHLQLPRSKLLCAWLGAIALVLAGRPERKWAPFHEYLVTHKLGVPSSEWSLLEMTRCIQELKNRQCPYLCVIEQVHGLFLRSAHR